MPRCALLQLLQAGRSLRETVCGAQLRPSHGQRHVGITDMRAYICDAQVSLVTSRTVYVADKTVAPIPNVSCVDAVDVSIALFVVSVWHYKQTYPSPIRLNDAYSISCLVATDFPIRLKYIPCSNVRGISFEDKSEFSIWGRK